MNSAKIQEWEKNFSYWFRLFAIVNVIKPQKHIASKWKWNVLNSPFINEKNVDFWTGSTSMQPIVILKDDFWEFKARF